MAMNLRAGLVATGVLLALVSGCMSVDDEIQTNKERAETIISHVYEYHQEHGSYPEYLDDLVPDYMAEIPKSVGGWNFYYRRIVPNDHREPPHFELGFTLVSRSNKGCGYMSRYHRWECGYGD